MPKPKPLRTQSVALPCQPAPSMLNFGLFLQEPAIARLDRHFTPKPMSEEHICVEPLRTSTRFYPGFILHWFSSPGFRSSMCDFPRTHGVPRALRRCGLLGFPAAPPWRVSLATHRNSPARFSTRTLQPLRAATYFHLLFSGSFDSLLRVLFSIPSRYSYAIGLGKYLGFEVTDSDIHTRIPTRATL